MGKHVIETYPINGFKMSLCTLFLVLFPVVIFSSH